MRRLSAGRGLTLLVLLAGLSWAAPPSRAQVAGGPRNASGAEATTAASTLYEAVRTAWLVPEAEARAFLGSRPPTLPEFAVLAMVRHDTGTTLADAARARQAKGTWSALVGAADGDLHDLVFKGDPRYPLREPVPQGPGAGADARIVELAEVMTLERLTGQGPGGIIREIEGGEPFEALVGAAWTARGVGAEAPGSTASGREKPRRGRADGGPQQPPPGGNGPIPGAGRPGEVKGWVGD